MSRYEEVRPASAAQPVTSGWKVSVTHRSYCWVELWGLQLPEPEEPPETPTVSPEDGGAPAPAEIYPRW